MVTYFVLPFSPWDVFDETWNWIVSVSEDFFFLPFDAPYKNLTGDFSFRAVKIFFKVLSPTLWIRFKFGVGLKSLLQHGLTEPEYYGDLGYKLRNLLVGLNFLISLDKLSWVTNVLDIP